MLQWITQWWKYALFAAATVTATAAADTMIPDPFLSRLAALAIPTFGGSKMILELFDKKGMERKLQEKEREAYESRREADGYRREADESRREANESRREADDYRRENQELRRRIEELERNGHGHGNNNPPPTP